MSLPALKIFKFCNILAFCGRRRMADLEAIYLENFFNLVEPKIFMYVCDPIKFPLFCDELYPTVFIIYDLITTNNRAGGYTFDLRPWGC